MDSGPMKVINGCEGTEMPIDSPIGNFDSAPRAVAGYVCFNNEGRPMFCLDCMPSKQRREDSFKINLRPLSPDQRFH